MRVHRTVALSLLLCVASLSLVANAETTTIPLPAQPQTIGSASQSGLPTPNSVFGPNKAPGPVTNTESVTVSAGFDGIPRSVMDTQTLRVAGKGDFSLRVPANAIAAAASPVSEAEPLLRRGNVVWQGFSPGSRTLGATISLDPILEITRLPLAPIAKLPAGDAPSQGPFELSIHVQNASADLFTFTGGDPDPDALAATLETTDRLLQKGQYPLAGRGDIPAALPGTPSREGVGRPAAARLEVRIQIEWAQGTLEGVSVAGAKTMTSTERILILSGEVSPSRMALDARISGTAHGLRVRRILIDSKPLPPADSLSPASGTWRSFLTGASRDSIASALGTLERTLASSARAVSLQGYLGNPWTGPSDTSYRWELASAPSATRATRTGAKPFGIALAATAFMLCGGVATALRRRS